MEDMRQEHAKEMDKISKRQDEVERRLAKQDRNVQNLTAAIAGEFNITVNWMFHTTSYKLQLVLWLGFRVAISFKVKVRVAVLGSW